MRPFDLNPAHDGFRLKTNFYVTRQRPFAFILLFCLPIDDYARCLGTQFTGQCQVLAAAQLFFLISRRVDNSVARSIQCSIRSFMRS